MPDHSPDFPVSPVALRSRDRRPKEHAGGELAEDLAGYAGGLVDGYDWSLDGALT